MAGTNQLTGITPGEQPARKSHLVNTTELQPARGDFAAPRARSTFIGGNVHHGYVVRKHVVDATTAVINGQRLTCGPVMVL